MKKALLFMALVWGILFQAQAVIPSYVPTNGLVGWWPFNGNANDESGNGNNGTVNGATLSSDRFGNGDCAYYFDGLDDKMDIFHNQSLNIGTSDFSISLYINPTSNSSTSLNYILNKRFYSLGNGYSIYLSTLRKIHAELLDANSNTDNGTSNSVNLSQWYHFVVVFNRLGNSNVYLNGILEGSLSINNESGDIANNNNLSVGYFSPTGPACSNGCLFYNGKIDDIGIWNRALTQQEITNLYNGTAPVACNPLPANLQNGLVGYWPFCGNANDESGNGNNLTEVGGAYGNDRFGGNSAYTLQTDANYLTRNWPSFPLAQFTINVWCKISCFSYGAYSFFEYGQQFAGQSGDYGINLGFDSANEYTYYGYFGGTNGGCQGIAGFISCSQSSNWFMLSISRDSLSVKLYLNGILISQSSCLSSQNIPVINDIIRIGNSDNNSTGATRQVDDIGIWNRALTSAEVQQLYQSQSLCSLTTNFFPQDTIRACGTSYTLDAGSGYSSYSWSTGATTQSISATSTGWYRCTVTQGSCSATDSVFVSLLNGRIAQQDTVICLGNTINLNIDTATYTSVSSVFTPSPNSDQLISTNYLSFNGPSSFSSPYLNLGNYYLQVSGTWCGGSCFNGAREDAAFDFYNGSITPINYAFTRNEYCPQGISGCSHPRPVPDQYNLNHTYYYPFTTTGGVQTIYGVPDECCWGDNQGGLTFKIYRQSTQNTYLWSTGATTSSITVSPTQTTTYYCTVSNGISSCTDSVTVTVNNLSSNLFAQDTVRACGASYTVDAGAGYSTYAWSTGATTQSISATSTGWYRCTVTQGGCSATDSVFVSLVNGSIITNDTTICNSTSVTLTAGGSGSAVSSGLSSGLQQGLIAYWPFNGNANDVSGNGFNGQNFIATPTNDRFNNVNNATRYYYPNAKTIVNHSPQLSLNNTNYTISAWVYLEDLLPTAVGYGGYAIITKRSSSVQSGYIFAITAPGNTQVSAGKVGLSVAGGGDPQVYSTSSVPLNSWTHVVVTYDLINQQVSFFLNGQFVNSASGFPTPPNSSFDLWIGNDVSLQPYQFHGNLDDVAIWNRKLTNSEIQSLYNSNALSYLWSTGATTPTITVSPTQTTTYYCTVSNGISSCTDSVTVTVNNLSSNLFAQDTVRACGAPYTVDAGAGYSTYAWSTGATTQTISTTSTGWYRCTVTQGGCSATDSVFVSLVNSRLLQHDTIICRGSLLQLSMDTTLAAGATYCMQLPINLRQGIVAYYPFCGNANDASGNGNNATLTNPPPTLTSDRFGTPNSAYQFDIYQLIFKSMLNYGQFSVGAWAQFTDYSACTAGGGVTGSYFVSHKSNDFFGNGFALGQVNGNFSWINYNTASNPWQQFPGPVNLNQWYYVMQTYSSTGLTKLYINGLAVDSMNYGPVIQGGNTYEFKIGGEMDLPTVCWFKGKIDDVVYYNRVLSDSEINQLFRLNSNILTYSWSTGATTSSITVSPTQTTTYYCTVSNGISSCTDSVTVTVNQPTTSSQPAAACDSYSWNGQTYTQSGTYTYSTTNAQGCDSVATLNLTITPSSRNTTTASACGSYTWAVNQQTYSVSGTYSVVSGCHTEVLDLTINPAVTNTNTVSACNSYVWPVTGQTYTQSGNYTSVSGCTVNVLALTITSGNNQSSSISACDSYVWPATGQTYTQSGTYSYTSGCDVYTLQLTITPSSSTTSTVTACTSYLWPATGLTYTSSGSYTVVSGCRRDVLELTIAGSSSTSTVTACGSYLWPANGQTYTQSGSYSQTSNCHTDVLSLTIIPVTTNSTTASACDSYTWPINGRTYTSSGSYSYTVGCNTEILNLTIIPRTTNSTPVTACSSYLWPMNGQTYTSSGNYTYINNCQTEILSLTIQSPSTAATGITTSASTVTAGTGVTLTVNGGTLGTGAVWKWYASSCGGTAVGTGSSITLTPSSTTTYYVRAEGACNTTPCVSTTITVNTVICGPTGITTNVSGNSICSGSSITLAVQGTLSSGATWKWYKGGCGSGTALGSSSTLTVRPTTTTIYFVRATGGSCGTTSCASVTVTVRPLPTLPAAITGPASSLCSRTSVAYSIAAVSGATSYLWTVPVGATIVSGQGTTTVLVNFGTSLGTNSLCGGASLCVQSVNACGSSSPRCLSLSLTPTLSGSITGLSSLTANQQTTYSVAAVSGATSYAWSVPTGWTILSGQGTVSITVRAGTQSGTVKVVPQNACGSGAAVSKSVRVGTSTSRLAEDDRIGVTPYPNPVSGTLYLKSGDELPERMELWDMLGNLVIASPWVEQLDMSTFAPGMYVLRFYYQEAVEVKRVQVTR